MALLLLRSNCGAPFNGSRRTGGSGGGTFLRNNHHRSSDNNQDSDYSIINLPLQCDVTLVPRITIPNNNNNVPSSSSSTIHKLHTLKVPNQVLNPCGINNIISIDDQELFNTNEGEDNDNDGSANYLLSLTHCVVNIDMKNNDNNNITSLPVTANPSTFQFTFYKEKNDKESIWGENNNVDDVDTILYTNGKVHRVGEIHTSFDYTTAIEYYQENVRNKKNQQQKNDEVCNKLHNNNSTTIHNTKRSNPEVTSIMISLENESRFIKQTLTVLGCLGVVFTVALVWTLSKMSTTKKKIRRRRVIVNDSWRYSVPREVVDTGKDVSVKTDEGLATPLVDNVSPLSTVVNADEQSTDLAAVTTSNEESKVNHETLHLVSPFTPLQPAAAAAVEDTKKQQDNGTRADMNKSPRHWYEDFLSPPTNNLDNKPNDTKFSFTAKNEVSRSLFSPLKASAAAKNDVPSNKGEEVIAVVEELPKDTNKKFHHLPRKELDFNTPIERSDFSPPPSSVNMLALPIESEITFDSSSDMSESSVPQVVPEGTTEETPVGNDDTTLTLNHLLKQEEGNLAVEVGTPFELEESKIVSEIGCQPGTLTLSQINVDESSIVKSEWSMSQELSNVEEISSNGSTIYEYVPMEEDGDAKDDKVGELDSVDKQSSVSEVAEVKDSEDYTQDDAVENSSSPKIASSSKSPVSDVVDSSTPKPTKTPKRLTPVPTPRATKTPDSTGESSDEMFSDYW